MIPVRLCCGQAHNGPVCPDGRVLCCLCFNRYEIEDLNMVDGVREDVCIECATKERRTR